MVKNAKVTVLIETYWNVKSHDKSNRPDNDRINRNILECKEMRRLMRSMLRRVLIETYWNVKDSDRQMIRPETSVLIETYWNVKITASWIRGYLPSY